jgi:hypothetical protein
MTPHAKRVLLAAGIAPWVVIVASLLWGIWYCASSPRSTSEIVVFPDTIWEFVLVYSICGVPTAYLSLIVFLPLYYAVHHFGFVSYWTVAVAGLLTCLPAALLYGWPSYAFVGTLVFLLPFGAAVAMCFLWILRQGAESGASPTGGSTTRFGDSGDGGGPPSVS